MRFYPLSQPALRLPAPAGFTGGTADLPDGSVFVPYSADLSPAGWLHDIGPPSTEPTPAVVSKGRIVASQVIPLTHPPITAQAFQRPIPTDGPGDPEGY